MFGPWPLHRWQQQALDVVSDVFTNGRSYVTIQATMGAGKTYFGGQVLALRRHLGLADFRIVVTPTRVLKRQWADELALYGFKIKYDFKNEDRFVPRDFDGMAVTYAQVASNPALFERICRARRVDVICDESHHMGAALTWGRGAETAFRSAFILALSGTPFRSDDNRIPFLVYQNGLATPDYVYSYTHALRDQLVRPVVFIPYQSDFHFQDDEVGRGWLKVSLGAEGNTQTQDKLSLQFALNPESGWMKGVLSDANQLLSHIRGTTMPTAAGMVVGSNIGHAEGIAETLETVAQLRPHIVVSDSTKATTDIAAFSDSKAPWLTSVKMVGEGANIKRLLVGVLASTFSTELYFRQWVGRYIRRTPYPERGQVAYCFIPADPTILSLAKSIEIERQHAISDEELEEKLPTRKLKYEPSEKVMVKARTNNTQFTNVVYRGQVRQLDLFGGQGRIIDLPKQVEQVTRGEVLPMAVDMTRDRQGLIKEIRTLVGILVNKSGQSFAQVYGRLKSLNGGKEQSSCTNDELETRIHWLSVEIKK